MIQGVRAADDGAAALEPRGVPRRAPGRQMETKGAAALSSADHILGPRLTVIVVCFYGFSARA